MSNFCCQGITLNRDGFALTRRPEWLMLCVIWGVLCFLYKRSRSINLSLNQPNFLPVVRFCRLVCISVLLLLQFVVPFGWADTQFPSLRQRFDPELQRGLERVLDGLELTDAVRQKQLCVALVDISDLEKPRVAAVNGDHMVYAASLPKIAILLEGIDDGIVRDEIGTGDWSFCHFFHHGQGFLFGVVQAIFHKAVGGLTEL